MSRAFRALAAIFIGTLVAFALVVFVELFSSVVHPLPADFKGTEEEMCQHVARYPSWVLAIVVPAWAVTEFAGTWTAKKFGNLFSFAFVGVLLATALVLNISMLPYPLWFKVADLIAIPLAIAAAARLARHEKV